MRRRPGAGTAPIQKLGQPSCAELMKPANGQGQLPTCCCRREPRRDRGVSAAARVPGRARAAFGLGLMKRQRKPVRSVAGPGRPTNTSASSEKYTPAKWPVVHVSGPRQARHILVKKAAGTESV